MKFASVIHLLLFLCWSMVAPWASAVADTPKGCKPDMSCCCAPAEKCPCMGESKAPAPKQPVPAPDVRVKAPTPILAEVPEFFVSLVEAAPAFAREALRTEPAPAATPPVRVMFCSFLL